MTILITCGVYDVYGLVGWRKQFHIGQAKIQTGMSAWVVLEHAGTRGVRHLLKSRTLMLEITRNQREKSEISARNQKSKKSIYISLKS